MAKIDIRNINAEFSQNLANEDYPYYGKRLLKIICSYLEKDEPLPDLLKNHLVIAFKEILEEGADPKKALLLAGKRGRSPKDDLMKKIAIAQTYINGVHAKKTYKNIDEDLKPFGIKHQRAEQIYQEVKFLLDNYEDEIEEMKQELMQFQEECRKNHISEVPAVPAITEPKT
jgi:hypothetical protein